MRRFALALVAFACVHEGSTPIATAQDNLVVRTLIRDVLKKELSTRNSKERGWRQGDTWLWLDNPSANLAADITKLVLDDNRLAVDGRATAMVAFNHRIDFPIGSKTVRGQARIYFSFRASARAGEKITGATVAIDRLQLSELRLSGDAVRPFQQTIQQGLNALLKHKKHDLERKLEEALMKVKMPFTNGDPNASPLR